MIFCDRYIDSKDVLNIILTSLLLNIICQYDVFAAKSYGGMRLLTRSIDKVYIRIVFDLHRAYF